ncbi:MAG: CRTAC1 family protein [Thermoanaerobaculia bacterium]|nr:CRTAC1 family protein [Thermoanaerobaculia bacterium]
MRRPHSMLLTLTLPWSLLFALGVMATAPVAAKDWFREVSAEVGVDFRHQDGRTGENFYVETAGSGGGWVDFDGDGDLDLYLVNGAPAPGDKLVNTPRNALFENREGRFVEVAAAWGVDDTAFGMGFCVGDPNGDGRVDLFVTNFGPDRLYSNRGSQPFEEVAAAAGVAGNLWSSACAFGDLDGDGDQDLYVSHYVQFDYRTNPRCGDPRRNLRYYCRPDDFQGVPDSLFLNRGDGTFFEAGAERGLSMQPTEKGFGVILLDLDQDGDLDIYTANDGALNRLYQNDGAGHFQDVGLWSGAGLSSLGTPEAGMGVAAGDIDGDLQIDLLVTHFAMETNTLYRNLGKLQFDDVTQSSGIGAPGLLSVGWGAQFLDYDNDGDLDVAIANGHMQEGVEKLEPQLRYRQPNHLLENRGNGHFVDITSAAGSAWSRTEVSRGLAVGDWNDDGQLDILIVNTNAAIDLLENQVENGNHWIGFELQGPPNNRLGLGATVILESGDRRQIRTVQSGGSFQSQSDLRLHFGLGKSSGPVDITILWPGGKRQSSSLREVDRYTKLLYAPGSVDQ